MSKMLAENTNDVVTRISDNVCKITVSHGDVHANCISGPNKLAFGDYMSRCNEYLTMCHCQTPLYHVIMCSMSSVPRLWFLRFLFQGVAGPCPTNDKFNGVVDIHHENLRHPNQQTHGAVEALKSFMHA